ncbi:hypothetical protein [Paraburkholderia heleia]|uniref:hypothetical protein n=1 Tax=Paraburkholderia heleia TaxID=634127 RepID=UPI002AB7D001|nr:hypothetical protein [Paraburkholderia heleia]
MSKGTIRLPASAITGGRVGTARIREQIASAARELADATPTPLDATIRAIAGTLAVRPEQVMAEWQSVFHASPVERMQQLGRQPRGTMNKTEAAYAAEVLELQLHAGEILWYRFEAIKLRLADRTFITIDFPVITAAGQLEFREVKGRWTDDARAKTKIAASQFPFRFIAIQRDGCHGWRTEDLTSRSW